MSAILLFIYISGIIGSFVRNAAICAVGPDDYAGQIWDRWERQYAKFQRTQRMEDDPGSPPPAPALLWLSVTVGWPVLLIVMLIRQLTGRTSLHREYRQVKDQITLVEAERVISDHEARQRALLTHAKQGQQGRAR